MENREEILKALRTIQNVCKEHLKCDNCPLSKSGCCVIGRDDPLDWNIKATDTWKAFED
jgi:hypothetical protein